MVEEYISRKVLKELFDGIHDCADLVFEPDDQICSKQYSSCGSCRWIETKRAIQKRVMSIPAADVRPVVLCRDCKYYFKDADGYEMCDNSDGYDHVTEDGFCAWAVKMEG